MVQVPPRALTITRRRNDSSSVRNGGADTLAPAGTNRSEDPNARSLAGGTCEPVCFRYVFIIGPSRTTGAITTITAGGS